MSSADLAFLQNPLTFAVLGVLIFLGFVAWKLAPLVRKFTHLVDDFLGEPERPGVPERPGLMSRMSALEQNSAANTEMLGKIDDRVQIVEHEVTFNDGSSVKDATTRMEKRLTDLHTKFMPEAEHPPIAPGHRTH